MICYMKVYVKPKRKQILNQKHWEHVKWWQDFKILWTMSFTTIVISGGVRYDINYQYEKNK